MEDVNFEELIKDLRDDFLVQTRYTLESWIHDYFNVSRHAQGDHHNLINEILKVISELDPELMDKISHYTKTPNTN